jgi:hypothetical protein
MTESAQSQQYFTLEQANSTLSFIRPRMALIMELRQRLIEMRPELWPIIEKAAGNGGGQAASTAGLDFENLDRLVREIQATGAIIKDINIGLVDFLHERYGRIVYLCWKYDEPEIKFWHELNTGLADRKPV